MPDARRPRPVPRARRRQAEWSMALLSLGAAFENLLLAASAAGLAACWVAAPVFCPDTARDALGLPDDWQPQAMALVGYPDPSYRAPDRRPIALDTLRAVR
ncbi:MAG: nitroreductase family protein [Acidimicrobiia bacterium]|nr:nitroreductase family protein [Acidimicrobiia bacterium]